MALGSMQMKCSSFSLAVVQTAVFIGLRLLLTGYDWINLFSLIYRTKFLYKNVEICNSIAGYWPLKDGKFAADFNKQRRVGILAARQQWFLPMSFQQPSLRFDQWTRRNFPYKVPI